MTKLLPILIILLGIGLGGGAGYMLRPAPDSSAAQGDSAAVDASASPPANTTSGDHGSDAASNGNDFVKLNNQFIVPIVTDATVSALVVISLSLEVSAGGREVVFQYEPKLRDALLSVLFDHATVGGFNGRFTAPHQMDSLRTSLTESAQQVLPEGTVHHVLIMDLVRQDIG